MEFTFSPHRWVLEDEPEEVDKSFALGLHMTGRYDKILDINNCHLQPEIGNRILSASEKFAYKILSSDLMTLKRTLDFYVFLCFVWL